MAKLVSDIQQLINDRADNKLKADLRKLHNLLYNGEGYEMLKDISVNVGTPEKPRTNTLAYILGSGGFENEIIEKNTERYRAKETKEFLAKVDSLRQDVDNLLDNQTYD